MILPKLSTLLALVFIANPIPSALCASVNTSPTYYQASKDASSSLDCFGNGFFSELNATGYANCLLDVDASPNLVRVGGGSAYASTESASKSYVTTKDGSGSGFSATRFVCAQGKAAFQLQGIDSFNPQLFDPQRGFGVNCAVVVVAPGFHLIPFTTVTNDFRFYCNGGFLTSFNQTSWASGSTTYSYSCAVPLPISTQSFLLCTCTSNSYVTGVFSTDSDVCGITCSNGATPEKTSAAANVVFQQTSCDDTANDPIVIGIASPNDGSVTFDNYFQKITPLCTTKASNLGLSVNHDQNAAISSTYGAQTYQCPSSSALFPWNKENVNAKVSGLQNALCATLTVFPQPFQASKDASSSLDCYGYGFFTELKTTGYANCLWDINARPDGAQGGPVSTSTASATKSHSPNQDGSSSNTFVCEQGKAAFQLQGIDSFNPVLFDPQRPFGVNCEDVIVAQGFELIPCTVVTNDFMFYCDGGFLTSFNQTVLTSGATTYSYSCAVPFPVGETNAATAFTCSTLTDASNNASNTLSTSSTTTTSSTPTSLTPANIPSCSDPGLSAQLGNSSNLNPLPTIQQTPEQGYGYVSGLGGANSYYQPNTYEQNATYYQPNLNGNVDGKQQPEINDPVPGLIGESTSNLDNNPTSSPSTLPQLPFMDLSSASPILSGGYGLFSLFIIIFYL